MLIEQLDKINLKDKLKSREDFKPFPNYMERMSWEAISEDVKKYHIGKAEQYLGYVWPLLTATAYMEFSKSGNRSRYDNGYFERAHIVKQLLLGECLEGEGRIIRKIMEFVELFSL